MIRFEIKSAEFEFVLRCACWRPEHQDANIVKNALPLPINWDIACDIAETHRLLPHFYKNLKLLFPQEIPETIFTSLKSKYFENAVRNTRHCSFLVKVLSLLNERNICVIAFKGPVLAKDIYGSYELRQFSDIDILVSLYDVPKSWDILIHSGFRPDLYLDKAQLEKYIAVEDHMGFSKGNIYLELHWELTGLYLSHPVRFDDVNSNLQKIKILKQAVSTLSPETLFVYLCIHGNKHGWAVLEQICCLDRIIRSKKLDWNEIEDLCSKWKCKRMILLACFISQKLFETPMPFHLLKQIKNDNKLIDLGKAALNNLSKTGPEIDRFSLFHIQIRDSISDKFRYALRLFFVPTDKEFLYYPVPAGLTFIHTLIRPLRLVMTMLYKKTTN